MAARFGIDIGGTFTDFVYQDEDNGKVIVHKVPTTPENPAIGCIEAIQSGLSSSEIVQCNYFLHGSTIALNTILERNGARLGLLTTKGFRDVLELRRGDNSEYANIWWRPAPPLVPRHLRKEVDERIRADGTVVSALNVQSVLDAYEELMCDGVDGIAIVLLNSYVNPEHELRVEEILREASYCGEITLSHWISREFGEYERTSTAVVDAYVRSRVRSYLSELESGLDNAGFEGSAFVTRSGGGSLTLEEAMHRPIETINSGPAAGVSGAARIARTLSLDTIVSADVGGTSFDTAIISNGIPRMRFHSEIQGMPLQAPSIDVRSIGAGGGSIAYVDPTGALKVGPQSAGANPGPASYGLGGTQPTVTDAALVLGMLGNGEFQSGLKLDRTRAMAAFRQMASRLNLSEDDCARGVIAIMTSSISNAIREITLEQGEDAAQMSLLAFGGAGPLFACRLAENLGIHTIVIPKHAGNLSAWGLLGSDIVREASRSVFCQSLTDVSLKSLSQVLRELFVEIRQRRGRNRGLSKSVRREALFDMCYRGQQYSLPVRVGFDGSSITESVQVITERYQDEYQKIYGGVLQEAVQVPALRAIEITSLPMLEDVSPAVGSRRTSHASRGSFLAYSFHLGRETPFSLVGPEDLYSGYVDMGPAIIEDQTSTIYVDANYSIEVHSTGHLVLTRKEH
jgi:N-methylhydantoinase A